MTTRPEDKKREPGKGRKPSARNRNRNRRRKLRAGVTRRYGKARKPSGPSRRLRFEDEDAPEGNGTTSGQHGPKPKGGKFRQDNDQPRPSDRMRQEDAPGGGEPSGREAGGPDRPQAERKKLGRQKRKVPESAGKGRPGPGKAAYRPGQAGTKRRPNKRQRSLPGLQEKPSGEPEPRRGSTSTTKSIRWNRKTWAWRST